MALLATVAATATCQMRSVVAATIVLIATGCNASSSTAGGVDASPSTGPTLDASTDSGLDGSSTDATEQADAAPCTVLLTSSYDQSCMNDDQCILVPQVADCPANVCITCTGLGAISLTAQSQYAGVLDADLAGIPPDQTCACPPLVSGSAFACCRAGSCAYCVAAADTLPTCMDAGGACFAASSGCADGGQGPPDACAYADEVCCTTGPL